MRILGYPADRITILTTYNGQRALLHDVLTQRCAGNPLIGEQIELMTIKLCAKKINRIALRLFRYAASRLDCRQISRPAE